MEPSLKVKRDGVILEKAALRAVSLFFPKRKTEMKGGAFLNGKPLISKAIPKLTAYPHFSYFIPGYITNTAYQAYCKQLHFSVYFTLFFTYLISIKSKYIRRVFNGLSETIPLYDFSCSSVLNIKSKPFFL